METIEKEITNSSQVSRVKYSEREKILTITYKTGNSYEYLDVSKEKFDGLLAAESVGKYLNAEIKNQYQYRKL